MNKKIRLIIIGTAVLSLALLYFFADARDATNFFPKCPFYSFTGLYCPGCGSQRAISALLHGDIVSAIHFNILMVASLPFIFYSAFVFVLNTFRKKQIVQKFFYSPLFAWIFFSVVIFFWIARNIPHYPFNLIAPHE